MAHLAEAFGRGRAHPLRGGIGRHPFGMQFLDPAQFLHQPVVFVIADDRRVEHVVAVVVVMDFPLEFLVAPAQLGFVHLEQVLTGHGHPSTEIPHTTDHRPPTIDESPPTTDH